MFPASRPSRGVDSFVALGLPGHSPKGAVPRYPPRGVLPDWSRPVRGSCQGVVSPLTGGFLHRNLLAVCDLGLAFSRFVVALVLVSVGTDCVVHVQRVVARHSAADDNLIRQVASGRHVLNSEVVRREGAHPRPDALALLLQRAW